MHYPAHPGHFYPDFMSIPFELYQERYGIEALLCDLDNHLFRYNGTKLPEDVDARLRELQAGGLTIVFGSNNPNDRSHLASEERLYLGTTYRQLARGRGKPHGSFFQRACGMTGIEPAKFISSGDNWLRDSFGAIRSGMFAITVDRQGRDPRFETHLKTRQRETRSLQLGYGIQRIDGVTIFVPENYQSL